jgi:membrane fusion protein (multidrug efflux system)
MNEHDQDGPAAAAAGIARGRRRLWLSIITGSCALLGAAFVIYWQAALRHHQSTDDAYVDGNVVEITPQISGTVVSIGADDTDYVNAGETLVKLDPADARVALDEAESQLGKTVRQVRNLFATASQLDADVQVRESDLARASDDLARREALAAAGAISREEIEHARDARVSAEATLAAARAQDAANRALVDHTSVASHPDIRNAAAHVREAYLALARTTVPAPVSGFVAKRAVQVGQRVAPGTALMAVVPLDQVWVAANFKEPQLADMRVGQPVSLEADLYGGRLVYHGRVVGFGAGTGSAFALLPAQNATGNWIKIVQRVAVRIALDPRELAANPLQIGLSMHATVDTHDRSGQRLPQLAHQARAYSTGVFDAAASEAAQQVKAIIAANAEGAAAAGSGNAAGKPPALQPEPEQAERIARLARVVVKSEE